MEKAKDPRPKSARPCCGKTNFQFITETPSRGFQPGQRFHIRSHVMKQYKQGQRRSQQVAKSSGHWIQGSEPIAQEDTLDVHGTPDNSHNLEHLADRQDSIWSQSRVGQLRTSPHLLEVVDPSRQLGSTSTVSTQRKTTILTDYLSSRQKKIYDAPGSRCQYCGALRADGLATINDREMGPSVTAANALWRGRFESDPVEPLGAGRVDPFGSYPAAEASPCLHELIDHAISYLLPGLVPDIENNAIHPVSKAWLSSGLENPLLFHAIVFAGSIHLDFLRSSQIYPDKPLSLQHKLVVIQKVNECLSDPDVASRDEIILAILILASHEAMNMSAGKENPFKSPLKNAQWLNIYSTIVYVQEHMQAVLRLVMQRGGLETIKMFGLAEVITAGDVIAATNSLSKPVCPLLQSLEVWLDYVENWAVVSPRPPVQEQSRGFLTLRKYGISPDTMKAFNLLGAITIAIDHHVRGEPAGLTLGAIAKVRTAAQHRTLCLPLSVELQDLCVFSPHIYEACRTTALMYSIAVIFPVANAYNLLQDLVQRLQASLMFFEMESSETSLSGVHLWMLVIGGIAASDGSERTWFVTQLRNFALKWEIYDWSRAEKVLQSFLWLESACSPGGKMLWEEAMIKLP